MQRRTFLSLCCVSAASLLPGHALAEAGESKSRYAMLIDLRRCVGCQSCTVSCGAENAVPLGNFRTTVSEYAMGGRPLRAQSALGGGHSPPVQPLR